MFEANGGLLSYKERETGKEDEQGQTHGGRGAVVSTAQGGDLF